jgi:phage terminase small subunit
MATKIPDAPADLGKDGLELWGRAWSMAITWLSPDSDLSTIENTCRAADDLASARARYRATTEPADARAVVALSKTFTDALSSLGFDPTARSRLGVAEVKRASALDNLIAKRQAK